MLPTKDRTLMANHTKILTELIRKEAQTSWRHDQPVVQSMHANGTLDVYRATAAAAPSVGLSGLHQFRSGACAPKYEYAGITAGGLHAHDQEQRLQRQLQQSECGDPGAVPSRDRSWSITTSSTNPGTVVSAADHLATHPEHVSPSAYLRASRDAAHLRSDGGFSTSRSVASAASSAGAASVSRPPGASPVVRSVVPIGSTPLPPSAACLVGADGKRTTGLMPPPPPSYTSFGPRKGR